MEDNEFVKGAYWNEKREQAPHFVNGSVSFKKDEFVEWLNQQSPNDKGYVKMDLLTSRDGSKKYFKLDTYQQQNKNN